MAGFELTLPADPLWSGVVNAVTAAGTAPMDLDVERIEDLLILTEEVVAEAVDAPESSVLTIRLSMEGDLLRLRVASNATSPPGHRSPFADTVLEALAEAYRHGGEDGETAIEFSFRARTRR